jgi:hypothetical protein
MINARLYTENYTVQIPVKPTWLKLVSSCKIHESSSFDVCGRDVYAALASHYVFGHPVLLQHADASLRNNLHLVKEDCKFTCGLSKSGSLKAAWATAWVRLRSVGYLARKLPAVVFDMIEAYGVDTMDVSTGDFDGCIQVRHIFASPQFTVGVNGQSRKPKSHWKTLHSVLWTFQK